MTLRAKIMIGVVLAASAIASTAMACAPSSSPVVSGPILDVPEAGVVCVALGPRVDQWVRVRLVGAEHLDRQRLMAAGFAKRVNCVMTAPGAGACRLAGENLATLAASPGVRLIADTWR